VQSQAQDRHVSGGMLSQVSALSPESINTAVFSDAHELPITPSPRLTSTSPRPTEIDGFERQPQTQYTPYHRDEARDNSEVRQKNEEDLARLRMDIEKVRTEKDRLMTLRELESREEELKNRIMEMQRRVMD